jgi:hypothetical protein
MPFFDVKVIRLANCLHQSRIGVLQGSNAAVVPLALHTYSAKQQEIYV